MEAYPLQWPAHKPRTRNPLRSRFKVTFAKARDSLFSELRRMGARNVVLSTNIPLKLNGEPYANFKDPNDRGAVIYFLHGKRSMCFACDAWDSIGDNIWAICKTVEALRGIERWGGGSMMEEAFEGFARLPSPSTKKRPWWEVMCLEQTARQEEIRAAYRRLAMERHPDRTTGSHEKMAELTEAYNAATKE